MWKLESILRKQTCLQSIHFKTNKQLTPLLLGVFVPLHGNKPAE